MNFLNYLWLPALTLIIVSCDVIRDEENLFESEDAVTFHFHERDSETNETTVMDSLAIEVPEPLYLDKFPRIGFSDETYLYLKVRPVDAIEVGALNLYALVEQSRKDYEFNTTIRTHFLGDTDSDINTHRMKLPGIRDGFTSITLLYRPLNPELADKPVSFEYELSSKDSSVPDSTGILEFHPDEHAITEEQFIEVDLTDFGWDYNFKDDEDNFHSVVMNLHEKYRHDELHLFSEMVLLRNWGSPFYDQNLRAYGSPFVNEPYSPAGMSLEYSEVHGLKPDRIRFYRFIKED